MLKAGSRGVERSRSMIVSMSDGLSAHCNKHQPNERHGCEEGRGIKEWGGRRGGAGGRGVLRRARNTQALLMALQEGGEGDRGGWSGWCLGRVDKESPDVSVRL